MINYLGKMKKNMLLKLISNKAQTESKLKVISKMQSKIKIQFLINLKNSVHFG